MNKWQIEGGAIEAKDWSGGGGRATCSKGKSHRSIHPLGRDDDYRAKARKDRYRAKLHGRREVEAPSKGRK